MDHRRDTMIRTFHFALCLVMLGLLSLNEVDAQARKRNTHVSYRIGLTTFDMKSVKELFATGLSFYRSNGIALRDQLNFPATVTHGGEISGVRGDFRFGGGYFRTSSMAFAGYKDGAGLVKLKAAANVSVLYAMGGMTVYRRREGGEGFIALKVGPLFGQLITEEKVEFVDFRNYNVDLKLDENGTALYVELLAGGEYRVTPDFILSAEFGYRYTDRMELPVWRKSWVKKIDFSGFSMVLTVGAML